MAPIHSMTTRAAATSPPSTSSTSTTTPTHTNSNPAAWTTTSEAASAATNTTPTSTLTPTAAATSTGKPYTTLKFKSIIIKIIRLLLQKNIMYNKYFIIADRCVAHSECTETDEVCLNIGTETAACGTLIKSLGYPNNIDNKVMMLEYY